jgi:hypothetical protein
LTDVPNGALILMAEMEPGHLTADMSRPTFVEYTYGKGRILAAAQCFHDQDNSGRGPLMPTLLEYSVVVSEAQMPSSKDACHRTPPSVPAPSRQVSRETSSP